ncbi:hypothetical protein GCM10027020_08420 [Nocardioides salsibiostraticola]
MDFAALEPNEKTAGLLKRIMADFAPDDPERPWTDGEMRIAVPMDQFPLPELARAALHWAGFVPQRWDDKTAWRLGGRFRDRNVSLASTKYGLRFMVEADVTGWTHNLLDTSASTDISTGTEAGGGGEAVNASAGATPTTAEPGPRMTPESAHEAPAVERTLIDTDEIDALLRRMMSRRRIPKATSATRHDLTDDPGLEAFVEDFIARLGRAGRVFDEHVFSKIVKEQLDNANITVLNQHARLRGGYDYFRWQAQAFIDGHGDDTVLKEMESLGFLAAGGKLGDHLFMPLVVRNQLGYCLTAMAAAYFSWLEHVLVLALPFTDWEPEQASVTQVIGDTWPLKWERVIPITAESSEAFDRLRVAAEEFRNLDAHGGFGKKARSLLIHTPVGAVPARLTQGADAIRATVVPDTPTTFPQACEVFDATDKFLRNGPLAYAIQWIEAGIQVPFGAEHRAMFKDALNDGDDAFEKMVDRFADLEDRVNNFEMY